MDKIIEQKKGIKRKHIPYIAGGVFVLAVAAWLIFADHSSSLRIDSRTAITENVLSGEFNDYTRVNGSVMPITTVQLSPLEGGTVNEKVVEEGSIVRKGDVIIKLSNPGLNMEILTAEAEKEAAILRADAVREQKIREAQGEAEAIMMIQTALADSIKLLNDANPSDKVISLKGIEAFGKAADGQATKIIIPSEIQSLAGLAVSLSEIADKKK